MYTIFYNWLIPAERSSLSPNVHSYQRLHLGKIHNTGQVPICEPHSYSTCYWLIMCLLSRTYTLNYLATHLYPLIVFQHSIAHTNSDLSITISILHCAVPHLNSTYLCPSRFLCQTNSENKNENQNDENNFKTIDSSSLSSIGICHWWGFNSHS